jgi:hypothetical protein
MVFRSDPTADRRRELRGDPPRAKNAVPRNRQRAPLHLLGVRVQACRPNRALGWEPAALTRDYVWINSGAIPRFRSLHDVPAAFLSQAA